MAAGCGRLERQPRLLEGVSVESQISEGIFWASLLRDAADLSTLTAAPLPFERSVQFSTQWWGEGDEIIWLDREDEPAWRGTGTEDYFGFAWCSDKTFQHPLRGQTRAEGSRSRRRVAAMHRYHLLDRLPFQRRARFELEAWGLGEGYMDYDTAVLGYAGR